MRQNPNKRDLPEDQQEFINAVEEDTRAEIELDTGWCLVTEHEGLNKYTEDDVSGIFFPKVLVTAGPENPEPDRIAERTERLLDGIEWFQYDELEVDAKANPTAIHFRGHQITLSEYTRGMNSKSA